MADNVAVLPGCKLPAAGFLGRLHVLVVDDDTAYLKEVKIMLLLAGYSVTGKTTAEEALQELERNSEGYFDVVMTDVHMPGMAGFDLLRRVRDRLPVIMYSEGEDMVTMMRAVMDGACDYMVKPMTSEAIRSIWMHVLRRRLSVLHPQASSLPAWSSQGDGQVAELPQHPVPVGNRGGDVQEAELAQPPAAAENGRGDIQEAEKAAAAGSSRGVVQEKVGEMESRKRGSPEVSDVGSDNIEPTERKKARARFIWSTKSHSVFLKAYNQLKYEAGPKRKKELMEIY